MNGTRKFHKATGPAFQPGEVWLSHSGKNRVEIVTVFKYLGAPEENAHTSDYGVIYKWTENGEVRQNGKDAWNFQVRYGHIADKDL